IPSICFLALGQNQSVRRGGFSAMGFAIIALGEAVWIMAFNFCIGAPSPIFYISIWFIQLIGGVILIFGLFVSEAHLSTLDHPSAVTSSSQFDHEGRRVRNLNTEGRKRVASILSIVAGRDEYGRDASTDLSIPANPSCSSSSSDDSDSALPLLTEDRHS
ncbi:MAG: hypothetical protein Q8P67_25925, partial [archaeon]|nr:hypothetical protein [archaeon]